MTSLENSPPDQMLWCWRHPRAIGAAGRCIGQTDLAVDARKAKRLAHRIRRQARLHGLPRTVWVSPLARSLAVGRWLARWGWRYRVTDLLSEMHFGQWDGRPWSGVPWSAVQAWQDDFLHHAPGGGESVRDLRRRVQAFRALSAGGVHLLVGHGGWINVLLHDDADADALSAATWPAAPPHGSLSLSGHPREPSIARHGV